MAPSRGRGKTRAAKAPPVARSTRSNRTAKDGTPDVYEEMLAEEARRSPHDDASDRPLKRRRVAAGVRVPSGNTNAKLQVATSPSFTLPSPETAPKGKGRARPVQTVEASSDGDSGDDSEFDFEDVDLDQAASPATPSAEDGIADVSISVAPTAKPSSGTRTQRKPISNAERALRLLVHKAHVLCLLGHCMYVNTWCNDINVQQRLHPLLSKKALANLRGRQDWTQFQQDRAFRDGLEQASEIFRGHFTINASGMKRATWGSNDENETNTDIPSAGRRELIIAAREMEGSQDIGNQLFCALLRSAGADVRLVCSLQTLPLTNAQAKTATPQKPSKPVIRAMPPYGDATTSDSNTEDNAVSSSATIGKVPSARRRLGQPSFNANEIAPAAAAPQVRKKPVRKLDYPIFWIEAFNTAHQKWTAIDPLVTRTIGKPSKFEPPSAYALNQMSYVVAFEDDGVVKDVTRRYTKAYNAKTRRNRVESTEDGTQWLKKALRLFRRRGGALDRDQTEDAELSQKEAREGLPGNVQDFKDHPVYALERHLKRHEMIEPKREVGKVNAGTAAKPRMEPVYRRSDVVTCRSGDKWYRMGRIIQAGEAPIKHVPARNSRRGRSLSPDAAGDDVAGVSMTALYAHYQTEVYVAPPVVKGKVPRNAFGNLDIYVPTMVPPGGTHVRHALAQQAAKIVRVDYADAVTGFKFKGRHGTAIIQGAIIPSEHAEAVEAVIDGLLNERLEEESMARSTAALRMWKRFLTGLRIKERVDAYGTDGEGDDVRREIDRQVDEHDEIAEAGGFFAEEPAMPTAGKFSLVEMARAAKATPAKGKGKARKEESESEEAEFSGGEESAAAEAADLPSRRSKRLRRTAVVEDEEDENGVTPEPVVDTAMDVDDGGGGGFLPDDVNGEFQGGGFVPDEEEDGGDHGGGGFVVEDDSAGGFLPDGDAVLEDTNEAGEQGLSGGGFVPDVENMAFREAQEANAGRPASSSEAHLAPSPSFAKIDDGVMARDEEESLSMHGALPNEFDEQQADDDVTEPHVTNVVDANSKARSESEEIPAQEDAESDRGSMISHDPEDEDAEPDWLESD